MNQLQTLTEEQLEFYHREGYVHLPGVLSADTLRRAQKVLGGWVDEQIQSWKEQGLIEEMKEDLPRELRFVELWRDAGKPIYGRSPRRDLVCKDMFSMLSAPELLDVAQDLLGTSEVCVHGVFNGRAKMPDQAWTSTPWHQDAQYFRDAEHTHVPTFWFPLVDVDIENSCLQVEPRYHNRELHASFDDDETGFVGIAPEVHKKFKGVPVPMKVGDVLCFTQKTPHAAMPNLSDRVRLSMDFRYESTEKATSEGLKQGFVARSEDPQCLTSFEEWMKKWDLIPKGAY